MSLEPSFIMEQTLTFYKEHWKLRVYLWTQVHFQVIKRMNKINVLMKYKTSS